MIIVYFLKNLNMLKLIDFSPEQLIEEIVNFKSNEIYYLNENEFITLLNFPRNSVSVDEINIFKLNNPNKIIHNFFEYYYFFQNIDVEKLKIKFLELYSNKFNQKYLILNFIQEIHKNIENLDLLNKIVYYIIPINRIITLSHILLYLRQDLLKANCEFFIEENKMDINQQKEKYWIFVHNYIINFLLDEKKESKILSTFELISDSKDNNKIEFPFIIYIKKLFNDLKNKENFVDKDELIINIRNDEFLEDKMAYTVRKTDYSKTGENFENFLNRVEQETGQYVNWTEFEQFFTKRGFPILVLKYNKNQDFFDKNEDKDERKKIFLWTLPNSKERRDYLKTQWSQTHFEKVFGRDMKYLKDKQEKITIPKDFLSNYKMKKKFYQLFWEEVEKQKEFEINEILNYKIPFKKIPKSTYDNIYQKLLEIEKNIKLENKRKSNLKRRRKVKKNRK